MRISYSQSNTYKDCAQHWHLKYKEKYDGMTSGASLFFGSAVDDSITALLRGQVNYLEIFREKWHTAENFGKKTVVFDNPEVVFANADFDEHVLLPEDITTHMFEWADELKTNGSYNPLEVMQDIAARKRSKFKFINKNELVYYNRCSWLSMLRKGELLVKSFKEQFLPKIEKVLATQLHGYIKRPSGDGIQGFIDMVLKLEGYDAPIIFDLKTAARPYTEEQATLSEQLTLYAAMKANDFGTNLTGYVVLPKNINKIQVSHCDICGAKKHGRHRTCNAVDEEGKRCGGQWITDVELKPEVQVIVRERTYSEINALLGGYDNIISAMKNGIVYKNLDKCTNWYGGKCAYYEICHKNDYSKVRKRGK